MSLPPPTPSPHAFDFSFFLFMRGQGQFKDCSIVRWAKVDLGGLDRGGRELSTFLSCVDIWEIGVKSRWTAV